MKKIPLLLLLLYWAAPSPLRAFEITPFPTCDQSPLAQIFGFPSVGEARLLPVDAVEGLLTIDVASHFTGDTAGDEQIILDGETYRFDFRLHRRFGGKLALGVQIPYLQHREGFLDSFIEDWHDTFHLPQGGRDTAPRKRFLFSYSADGRERLRLDEPAEGLGDIRLNGAWQLQEREGSAFALHSALKLPTGNSDKLLGSGSTDLALWLSGDHAGGGNITFFGGLGALFLTGGDILPDRQHHLAAFAALGAGWRPWPFLILKLQADGHTALFASELPQLGESLILTVGGSVDRGNTSLDIGVSEDVLVDTAPDVVFHLSVRHRR